MRHSYGFVSGRSRKRLSAKFGTLRLLVFVSMAVIPLAAVACSNTVTRESETLSPQIPTAVSLPSPIKTEFPAATETPAPSPTTNPVRVRPTRTPTPVFIAPETRTGEATGLTTTSDNITELYDPFQPEGDRTISAGQYRPAVPHDSITPVYVPRIRDPEDLQIPLTPEELVMGIEIDGESRAYPIGLMRFREMANDTLGGVPILVTW